MMLPLPELHLRQKVADTQRLWKLFWSAGRLSGVLIISCRLMRQLISPATAFETGKLVDRMTKLSGYDGIEDTQSIIWPLAILGGLLLAGYAAQAILAPLMYRAKQHIDGAHRVAVSNLVSNSETIEVLEQPITQDLIRRTNADPHEYTDHTPGEAALAELDRAADFVGFTAAGFIVSRFSWTCALLLLLIAALCVHMRYSQRLKFVRLGRSQLPALSKAERWQEGLLSPGVSKELRIFGFGDWGLDRLMDYYTVRTLPMNSLWKRTIREEFWMIPLVAVPVAVVLSLVAVAIVDKKIAIGPASSVVAAISMLFTLVGSGDSSLTRISGLEALRAYDALDEILSIKTFGGRPGSSINYDDVDVIRLDQVQFNYPGSDKKILDNLSLTIESGELLAIVGMNGAGKSTLIKILSGLYRPTEGKVLINNEDLFDIGPSRWREHISVIFQDFVKYELSVIDNITLGHSVESPDYDLLEEVARNVGLNPLLNKLPAGWETPLARSRSGGVDLSGGEWQQIVLARALYAIGTGAKLLVLDEPTAHLDVRTEFEVFQKLSAQRGKVGVVLISHRLSTVRQADRIVVLHGGRIAESGTHEELMTAGGQYATMFAIQAERFQNATVENASP